MFYILYNIDNDGNAWIARKYIKRARDLRNVTAYWMIPGVAHEE